MLELVRQGQGISGCCTEYLVSTVAHLEAMGIVDDPLHAIAPIAPDPSAIRQSA